MHARRPSVRFLSAAFALAAPLLAQSPPRAARVIPYPIDLPPAFLAAVEKGTRTLTGEPGAKHWTNYAHYDIAMELDVAQKRVTGTAKMTYLNRSPDELRTLHVHLRQNMMLPTAQRTRTVQPTNGLEVTRVTVDGSEVHVRARDTRLVLRLDDEIPRNGGKAEVVIEYAYDVPRAGTAPRNGYEGDRVFYLAYWYPQFAVYDDVDGWVDDPYRGNGEFYMGYADYDLAITVPEGYIVRATGELVNADEVLTEKARAALQQAEETRDIVHVVDEADLEAGAATAKSPTGKLCWKFHAENVRDTAISVGRTYVWDATHAVIKDRDGPGKDGVAMIHAVYEPGTGDWVRGAEYARHTIEYMSEQVYPYPWPHMTACEGVIPGGMEFPMMTIIGGGRPGGTIIHELIHMWFPMLVGSNEKRYAWQDEGFTSFWSTLCSDALSDRKNGTQRGIVGYVGMVRRGGDAACMRHADAYGEDNFGFASYSKPAAILHQLRFLLGDDTFFGAFRRYARDWAFKHPTPYDFFRTFADHAGQDLEPYFRTWFFETWTLDHAVADVTLQNGEAVVTIADKGRAMHPCVVEATYENGDKRRQTVPLAHWRTHTEAELTFPGAPTAINIDPDYVTLDLDRTNNEWKRGT